MSSHEARIAHVSDTALMVAGCRALETARPDGLVRDPFAERLAGARGMAIVRGLTGTEFLSFGIGIRSRFLDELVMEAVTGGSVETVLSLGAGLDTRPWRLDLPARLRWIEVDFPAILEHKAALMTVETPRCRLEQVAADLNDSSVRREVIADAGTKPAMLITEGLLMYLPAATVDAVASEAAQAGGFHRWVLDITSPRLAKILREDVYASLQSVRAADHLDGAGVLATLRRNGWASLRHLSYAVDARRVAMDRLRKLAAMRAALQPGVPTPERPGPDDASGVHLLRRG